MRPLLLALAAALAPAAAPVPAADAPLPARPLPRLGLVVDAGLPAGAGVLLQARLLDALRIQAGPMWSGVGWGVKGGLVLAPLRRAISPTLEVEGGYGFRADLSFLTRRRDVPDELGPVLERARYRFVAAYAGLEAGSPRGVSFFVRGGLAWIRASAPGTARSAGEGGTLEIGDARLDATVPCAKLGLQLWF